MWPNPVSFGSPDIPCDTIKVFPFKLYDSKR